MQPKPVARVVDVFGKAEKRAGGGAWTPLSVGDLLPEASSLRTGPGGAALLRLPDGHMVRVGERTTLVLNQLGQDKQFSLKVLSGQIWSLVKKANQPARFTVETPSAVAGVTGTLFCVALDDATRETTVSTDEGSVEVRASGEAESAPIPIRAGFQTHVGRRRPFGPERHSAAHRAMWRALHQEGAWSRQDGRGPMHLRRGFEPRLFQFLRAHRPQTGMQPRRRE